MRVINRSRKIIAINGEPFLPGTEMELPEGMEVHPSVLDYLKKGVLADVNQRFREGEDCRGGHCQI